MTRTILCATDFSPSATRACEAAAAIARRLDTTLILAHVYQPPDFTEDVLSDSLEHAAHARLVSEAERLRQTGVTVEESFLSGTPEDAISSTAQHHQAGLIILASQRKRGTAERWLAGSVVELVIESSSAPTLIIRDAQSFTDWVEETRPLQVFVGTDLSYAPDIPLLWAKELTRIGPCEFTVAYLNWIPDQALRLGFKNRASFFEESPRMQNILKRDLREKVTRILGDLPARIIVEPRWGRADAPLIELAKKSRADLMVVGTRQKAGLRRVFEESVSRGTLHHAPMNVAVVPLTEAIAAAAPLPLFNRVLVPTDFSDLANHAIPYAYSLAVPGGTVCLAHIATSFGPEEEEIARQLRSLIPDEAESRGIHTEISITENPRTAEAICHLTARFGADAVCIGSHGRSGISQALLGSVAKDVLTHSSVPVMIVKKQ